MRVLRFLEVAWRLVRSLAAPLGAILLVIGTCYMDRPIWWFYAPMLALSLIPLMQGWESGVYGGYMAISVVWSLVLVLFHGRPLTRLVLMGFTCIPAVFALVDYEAELWSLRCPRYDFDEFPYRFLTAKRRLELGLELHKGNLTNDIERVSYENARDLLRRIAMETPHALECKAALARLRYPDDADVMRELALSSPLDEVRLAALLCLPYPQEAELLEEQLSARPDYAGYDLALGWPHKHHFAFVSSKREDTDTDGCYIEHERSACACGMTQTVVTRIIEVEHPATCPMCGGSIQQAFYGGYSWRWECTHCGWIDDGEEDDDVAPTPSFVDVSRDVLSTTYEAPSFLS